MRSYNFFKLFSCCIQGGPSPPSNESFHSKSFNNSFNTEHYTEQMKEAFFTKLLLHKGLCLCQESSVDTVLPENFRIINSLAKYPKKCQIFLLKYSSIACIMATLNQINFSTRKLKKNPKAFQSHLCKVAENKKEEDEQIFESADIPIIPLKTNNINRNKEEFSKLVKGLPQEMIDHIVQRFDSGELIMDILNGIHSLSLQLAIKGVLVLAIEKSQKYLTVFKHNAGLWDFTDQVMALQGDFLEMKVDNLKPDAIIVNFKAETIDLLKEKFCLFKHIKPNIRETLKKAASITNKVVLILPKHVEIDEIALVFKDYFEGCKERNQMPLANSIEIECLSVNNKIEKIVVYYGLISTITPNQEYNYIKSILSEERDPNSPTLSDYSQSQISSFLNKLSKRLSYYQMTSCLIDSDTHNSHITQFQRFIQQIKTKFSISNEEIQEYLSNYEESPAQITNYYIKERAHSKIYEKDEDGSFHSWDISSTPGFNNEMLGLKENKRKITVEECKSAELNTKKNIDNFSFNH